MQGYSPDTNRWNLLAPPAWWVSGLTAFDPALVLIPSRLRPVHLLCRQAGQFSRGAAPLTIGHPIDADTQLYLDYGVLPVSWIDCVTWSMGALTYLLDSLKARDTWQAEGTPLDEAGQKRALFEGGTKVSRALDDRDAAAERSIDRENRERIWHATGEAWRYRQHLVGERVLSAGRATVDGSGGSAGNRFGPGPEGPAVPSTLVDGSLSGESGMPKHDAPAATAAT